MKWRKLTAKSWGWLSIKQTDRTRIASLAKANVLPEASVGRTHRRQGHLPPAGFEDRDDHRTACASATHSHPSRQILRPRIGGLPYVHSGSAHNPILNV